jgi:hypothetical protein
VFTLLGPGPITVPRGFIFGGRTDDWDYGFSKGPMQIFGPLFGEMFSDSLADVPSIAACDATPQTCKANARLRVDTHLVNPNAGAIVTLGDQFEDDNAPFDFTIRGGSWVLRPGNSSSRAPFDFSGTVGGVSFIGHGFAQLFWGVREDGSFFPTAIDYRLGATPQGVVPEPSSIILNGTVAFAALLELLRRRRFQSHPLQ